MRHALRRRHMTMIALGGVIGAGLFVGSGVVIQSAGPAAVVSFAITGLLVVLVMRMLGEMAVALPTVGSFYEYARAAFGDRPVQGELAGFLTGWMYWYFWVIVVALEAVAGAGLVRYWMPGEPQWVISLALLLLLPVGLVFWRTFEHGIGTAWAFMTTPAAISALWLSILIALIAVPLNTIFGVGAALVLARGNSRGKAILDALIDLGVQRVLTSGGAERAVDGTGALARLVRRAAGRIAVMAAGTVRPGNVAQIAAATGVPEVHLRATDAGVIRDVVRLAGY